MAIINFSSLKNGKELRLGNNTLVFDGDISAADVAIKQEGDNLLLSAASQSIVLENFVVGNLSPVQITFSNGSELLVGDMLKTLLSDDITNMLSPFFLGDEHRDQIRGMGGDDRMSGGVGNDLMFGQQGNDTIEGDGGDDRLDGGAGNDAITGGEGSDTIDGRAGNDTIIGGTGADILDGNLGADIYSIEAADSLVAPKQHDSVTKFISGIDRFDLMIAGEEDNYIEKSLENATFAKALEKAKELLIQNDGLKDYVFIAGNDRGWLFGEFTNDLNFDVAIELANGNSLEKLDYSDIVGLI